MAAVSTPQQAGSYRKRKQPARSKRAQDADAKYSIDTQLDLCRRLHTTHPDWVSVGEVVIPGHSRRYDWLRELADDCPEYADVLGRVQRRELDGLLVAYDDRAFRGVTLAGQLAVFCAQYGVQIRAADAFMEFQDPAEFVLTPLDKLLWSFKGYAAEAYADAFRKKTWPHLVKRVREKRLSLASTPVYGYDPAPDKNSPTPINPSEREWARRMGMMRMDSRWGYARIAREINAMGGRTRFDNEWSAVTVRNLLTNPYLAGYLRYGAVGRNGEQIRGQHEAVWSDEEWARLCEVNTLMAKRYIPPREREFSGLCACGICAAQGVRRSMIHHQTHNNGRSHGGDGLRCASEGHHDGRSDRPYHSNYHPVRAVRDFVIRQLQEELRDPAAFLARRAGEAAENIEAEISGVEAALRGCQRAWLQWDKAFAAEVIDPLELQRHRDEITAEREPLEARLAELRARQKARAAATANLRQLTATPEELAELLAALPDVDWQTRRRAYLLLIREIVLTKGQDPVIRWWG